MKSSITSSVMLLVFFIFEGCLHFSERNQSIDWNLLKEDGFEYEKVFDFPENWQDQTAHPK